MDFNKSDGTFLQLAREAVAHGIGFGIIQLNEDT